MATSKATRWEYLDDSYSNVEARLIDNATGRIVGRVRGRSYSGPIQEWGAVCDGKHIGDYVTEDFAKRAVESAIEEKSGEDTA